jgi:hypothetical protein
MNSVEMLKSFLWLELSLSKHSKKNFNTLYGNPFFLQYSILQKKKKTSQRDFSIECGAQVA